MASYLLITGLKRPSKVRAKLAVTLAEVGTCAVLASDTVRVDALDGVDAFGDDHRELVVRAMMQAVKDCQEKKAQAGLFAE